MKQRVKVTRRDFLKLAGVATLDLFLLGVGGAGYSFAVEPNLFTVETIRLKLPRLSRQFSGMRLAQISDIHMGGWMDLARLQRVADLVLEEKRDALLITGDFVIGHDAVDL